VFVVFKVDRRENAARFGAGSGMKNRNIPCLPPSTSQAKLALFSITQNPFTNLHIQAMNRGIPSVYEDVTVSK
jgi:hypothetical protein